MTLDPTDDAAIDAAQPSRPANDLELSLTVRPIVEQMLGEGMSTIDPGTQIWTPEATLDLHARIVENPIVGAGQGQWEKLDIQLDGASRAVVLLAAEIVFLRDHPLLSARPDTRREHVERVLAHLDAPATIPESLARLLARPSDVAGFAPGREYYGSMWQHVAWVARFVAGWHALGGVERAAARRDPWAMQQVMLASGEDRADIRNVMQFFLRPDAFECIATVDKKTRVRNGLAGIIGGPSGDDAAALDRDLLHIRAALSEEIDGQFHFWSPGVVERWDDPLPARSRADASTAANERQAEPRPRRYWLFAPGARASRWDEQREDGIMAIGWDGVGPLAAYESRDELRAALDVDGTGASSRNVVHALWQFQHDIAPGDIVYAKRGRREIVGRGEVTSDARHEPDREAFHHVRSVRWTHDGVWDHPGEMPTKTLTDVTAFRDYVELLESLILEEHEEPRPQPRYPKYGDADFLDDVYISEDRYTRLRSLVQRKKNVILAGPPGVGKTFAAKRFAYAILGEKDPDRVEMVQFHQSSSYEDFMMGYRPVESGGFELRPGPFHDFCERAAADDPDKPYFFIIDEINRGNISKIFGELLMLIEADKRGHALRLLYKDELFSVPPNVHIIGMMNTADRSLAVLDYALRRRFGFFDLTPGFDSEGFARWQREADDPALDSLVDAIRELNDVIADDPALGRGFQVGHSYVSGPATGVDPGLWLESVVHDELVPLLHEYWFDVPHRAEQWAARLQAAIA